MTKKKISELFQEQEEILLAPIGISMQPLLYENRDMVCLKRYTEKPKRYDMILYQRKDGSYILHRIMNIKNECYELCGDNQVDLEYGVSKKQILARVEYFYRKNKKIDHYNVYYRIYLFLWCRCFVFRKLIFYLFKKRRA